jgi:hypothetical protein
VQLSEDPDTATAQTVQEMCRQIAAASRDPLVRKIAFDAVRRIRGGPRWVGTGIQPFNSARVMAESCWWWCKHAMRFKHHGEMFEVWSADLGDPRTKLQLLISPDVLVRMRKLEGDCAIYTMMLAAMLESLGVRWEICTAAVDRRQPDIFSHVWPRAVLEDGGREALDASHGKYPGWQVPPYDIHRLKVWDEVGRELGNQMARQFSGLHAYRGSRRRGMGALVCLDPNDTSSCYEDSSSTTDTVWTNPYPTGTAPVVQGPVSALPPTAQITVPPQNTAAWAALAAQLVKGGFTLAQLNAMQPGTVINPSGQIVRQAPGYAVTTGGAVLNSPLNIGAGSSSSLLMIGGLIIGGVLLMSMSRGR